MEITKTIVNKLIQGLTKPDQARIEALTPTGINQKLDFSDSGIIIRKDLADNQAIYAEAKRLFSEGNISQQQYESIVGR